jgi:phosphoribosyl 1,2-cyclic phosphodiesterase
MLELCSIASGSSGNCICVGNDHTHILIDAGISGKRIESGLKEFDLAFRDIQGILITHEHVDHIAGLGVLARKYGIPMYTTEGTKNAILQTKSVGKIDEDLFQVISPEKTFSVGDLVIKSIPISHDAAQPVAFRIKSYESSVAVMTDLGVYDQRIIDELQQLDALLLEANHDVKMLQMGSYPYPLKQRILGARGHLSNESSGQLLCRILHDNLKGVMLGHLSKENNYEALAYEAVRMEITMGDNPYKAEDFHIRVAKRDAVSERIVV